jgi:hypothetical protein
MRSAILLLIALLAACATPVAPPPVVVHKPVEVLVPVKTPCLRADQVPALPEVPADAELLALHDYQLVITIDMLRRRLHDYAVLAQAAMTACLQQP